MLILSRNVGSAIRIGDDIHISVLSAHGMQVRLGITAPRDVSVHREEIYERLKALDGSVGAGIADRSAQRFSQLQDVLSRAERFIAGFEDDNGQEGVPELLTDLRAAQLAIANGREH